MNMTQTAKELNISQQALSKHIINVEKELNLKLFKRGKFLALTEAGYCFSTYAEKILDLKSQMISQLKDISQHDNKNIRIGITNARSPIYLPPLLSKFRRIFPDAKIQLEEEVSDVIFNDLQNKKLDLVIGIEPHDRVSFTSFPLCEEKYAIMTTTRVLKKYLSPAQLLQLGSGAKSASIEVFKNCPFVCFEKSLRIGKIFHTACKEAGFVPNIAIESKNMYTLLYLCASGVGVTLLPQVYFELARRQSRIFNSIRIFPVTDVPVQTQIMLTIPRGRYIPELTREFIKIASDEFKSSGGHLTSDAEIFAPHSPYSGSEN